MNRSSINKAAAITTTVCLLSSIVVGCYAIKHEIIINNTSPISNNMNQSSKSWPETDGSLSGNDRSFVYEYLITNTPAVITRTSSGTSPALTDVLYMIHNGSLSFGLIFLWVLLAISLLSKRMLKFIHASDGMK